MIRFSPSRKAIPDFSADDIVVTCVTASIVKVVVRVSLPEDTSGKLRVTRAGTQLRVSSQQVDSTAQLVQQASVEIVTRDLVPLRSRGVSRRHTPSSDMFVEACLAAKNALLAMQVTSVSVASKTHTCEIALDVTEAMSVLNFTLLVISDGAVIGERAVTCSLVQQIALERSYVAEPEISVRERGAALIVSVKSDQFSHLYKRIAPGGAKVTPYELVTSFTGAAEISVPAAHYVNTVFLCVAGENLESYGVRALAAAKKCHSSCELVVIRAASGCELLITDIANADVIIVKRRMSETESIIATEIVDGRRAISIIDRSAKDLCAYTVELLRGCNSTVTPPVFVNITGDGLALAPLITNVSSVSTEAGFKVTFDLALDRQSTDASVAKRLVSSVAQDFYTDELFEQRDLYDEIAAFGVTRVSKETGAEMFLGVVQSGSFSDVIAHDEGAERSFRYVVSSVSRNPASLLTAQKTVSSSAQPYTYFPGVHRHPYALQEGLLTSPRLRNLRHTSPDSVAGASRACGVVDVSFPASSQTDVSVSITKIGPKLAINIHDERHYQRECYVIAALDRDRNTSIVAVKHALSPNITVNVGEATIATAVAVVGLDHSIQKLITTQI